MFVSRVVERLDPELEAWRTRGLDDTYAILFIDAIHQKTRHNRTVRPTACYTVTGYGEAGVLEVLGVYTAPDASAESASFWHQVLIELQGRGVEQVLIVCADGLTGLPEAVDAVFPDARFQPCIVHLMRNTFRGVRWDDRRALAKDARRIYQAINFDEAEAMLEAFDTAWGTRYPASVGVWRKMLPKLIALYTYGKGLRKLVYTTNPIENVHRQMRKAFKTRGAMPNTASTIRLATLVLRKIDGKNQTRYRSDWPTIVRELHIHFPSLQENWGLRY
jgi:transposase-like protein